MVLPEFATQLDAREDFLGELAGGVASAKGAPVFGDAGRNAA